MSEHAGAVYLQHIRDELADQVDRKRSLEQRGQNSIAVSGALVTLLAAFSDVGVFAPDQSAATGRGLTVAVIILVVGAVAGVIATAPMRYARTRVAGMHVWLEEKHWMRPASDGERTVAKNLLDMLRTAKSRNALKAWFLVAAVGLQVVGVGVLAATLYQS